MPTAILPPENAATGQEPARAERDTTVDEGVRELVRRRLAERPSTRAPLLSRIPAAVLVPLFLDPGERDLRVWLVRRPETMRIHQGQVALPGGKCEPTDRDRLHTALREAYEEIGLPPDEVDVLGALDDRVTITGYLITPIVGWLRKPFTPVPLASEVARVFSVPLTVFEAAPESVHADAARGGRPVSGYRAEGETIWGATAAVLQALALRLRCTGAADETDARSR